MEKPTKIADLKGRGYGRGKREELGIWKPIKIDLS